MTSNVLFPGEKHVRTVHGQVSENVTNVTESLRKAFERVTPAKPLYVQYKGNGRQGCQVCGKTRMNHKIATVKLD